VVKPNGSHFALREVMSDNKIWTAAELAGKTNKPEYAVTATLRGMVSRKEVRVFKSKPPAPYGYQLKE